MVLAFGLNPYRSHSIWKLNPGSIRLNYSSHNQELKYSEAAEDLLAESQYITPFEMRSCQQRRDEPMLWIRQARE